jgi:hypothetical protein
VVSSAVYCNDPLLMGIAPAWALPLALRRAGLTPEQIDVWEIREAFSAQALGVLQDCPTNSTEFQVPDDKAQPQRGRRSHRASVRRHRRTVRPDPSHRTTATTSTLRRRRRVHRFRPTGGNGSGKPTSRMTATVLGSVVERPSLIRKADDERRWSVIRCRMTALRALYRWRPSNW